MKKRFIAAILALAAILYMSVPAMAAALRQKLSTDAEQTLETLLGSGIDISQYLGENGEVLGDLSFLDDDPYQKPAEE